MIDQPSLRATARDTAWTAEDVGKQERLFEQRKKEYREEQEKTRYEGARKEGSPTASHDAMAPVLKHSCLATSGSDSKDRADQE